MLATIINALAVLAGSIIGLVLRKGIQERYQKIIFTAAGLTSLTIGIQMALKTSHMLAFALALIVGGLLGTLLNIEGAVLGLGERLKRRFAKKSEGSTFAEGFLSASVLYCSGAMAIVGSFKAGTEGDYSIILTKSVLDGFMSIIFAGAMGPGVAFSALSILVYQGALTIMSVWVKPFVTDIMLAELTGIGGALVIMIGLSLLDIKKFKTGDFLPALVVIVLLVLAFPYIPFL
ncbi:MAG TPA: DUF554 domain-containing protein [Rectinemataceae bacterium]|nr:DUF554 domain-containing protein [Rectinemataceae bacterium]